MLDGARVGLQAAVAALEEGGTDSRDAKQREVEAMRDRWTRAFPGLRAEVSAMDEGSCAIM